MPDSFDVQPSLGRVRARKGVKWTKFGPDVMPLWVADMDFDPPPPVTQAIAARLADGDLGYGASREELVAAYGDWQHTNHGWRPDDAHTVPFTSALHALETVMWHLTDPGAGIVVFTPVYHPFLHAIDDGGRRRVEVELDPDGWRIDADRLDAAIDDETQMILFCNPHNPTGRVYDDAELAAVADAAERHDLLVISDEIWGDLTFDGPFRPLAISDDRFDGRLITLGSASKAFNLAGLRCAVANIDHAPTRATLEAMPGHLHGASSTVGIDGTIAAWRASAGWLDAVRGALAERRDHLVARVADVPGVTVDAPQGTYLSWLDFRGADIGADPAEWLLEEAAVALSGGPQFAGRSDGFARLNFATSAAILDEALDRIAAALERRG